MVGTRFGYRLALGTGRQERLRWPRLSPSRYDLSNIDFSRLRAEFEKSPFKNVVTLNLKESIEEKLAKMVARNPTRVDL